MNVMNFLFFIFREQFYSKKIVGFKMPALIEILQPLIGHFYRTRTRSRSRTLKPDCCVYLTPKICNHYQSFYALRHLVRIFCTLFLRKSLSCTTSCATVLDALFFIRHNLYFFIDVTITFIVSRESINFIAIFYFSDLLSLEIHSLFLFSIIFLH